MLTVVETVFVALVRTCIIVLGIGLVSLFVIGSVTGCVPAAPVQADDNGWCPRDVPREEAPIQLRVTTSFEYSGGVCFVQCEGIPDTECQILPPSPAS